ncbi:MAG: hypothetical protein U0103_14380 [Candidatus Obscuribacterales bacterium]
MIASSTSNRTIISIATTLALFSMMPQTSHAQDYQGASSLHGKTVIMPRGTTFEGRMDQTIGSKSRQGQPFTISMSAPVLANGTDVLIPAGSKITGEVVEAIPSGSVPHPKGMKPSGKLRVQLSSLRTPDGITYPIVASLAGETYQHNGANGPGMANKNLGGGIGYVGTQASFEAVAPGTEARRRGGGSNGLQMMTKSELMRDPIYGIDQADQQQQGGAKIRSLVKRGRELYIDGGSPVSIKLDAPFKIGISQAAGAAAAMTPQVDLNPDGTFGRRFLKQAPAPPQPQGLDPTIAPGENPLPGILPDVPHSQPAYIPPQQPVQQPPMQAAPPQQSMQAQPPGQLQPAGQAATPAKGDF